MPGPSVDRYRPRGAYRNALEAIWCPGGSSRTRRLHGLSWGAVTAERDVTENPRAQRDLVGFIMSSGCPPALTILKRLQPPQTTRSHATIHS